MDTISVTPKASYQMSCCAIVLIYAYSFIYMLSKNLFRTGQRNTVVLPPPQKVQLNALERVRLVLTLHEQQDIGIFNE